MGSEKKTLHSSGPQSFRLRLLLFCLRLLLFCLLLRLLRFRCWLRLGACRLLPLTPCCRLLRVGVLRLGQRQRWQAELVQQLLR